jgi:hypothetical protein
VSGRHRDVWTEEGLAIEFRIQGPERHSCGEGSSVCERPGAQNTRVARGMADAAALVAYGVP